MSQGNTPTESELLAESNEIFEQKKMAAKHMNVIATETSKMQKIQKSCLNRLKDYKLYKGNGWAGTPLVLDKDKAKVLDKVSPVFIKLLQIVEDLRAVESLDLIDDYIQAIDGYGIKLYVDPGKSIVSDKDEVISAIRSMGTFQKQINALSEEIKEIKSEEAYDINLTTKNEFPKLVAFYNKKESGKDCDDQYQDLITDFTLREEGYTKVYDGSLS